MIIVIDAYNMIKQVLRSKQISDAQRTEFVVQLRRYATRKKHKMIVVFDAGPYQWVHKEQVAALQVVYSGAHATADDYIMQYLDGHQQSDILLVSTDHELVVYASDLSIPSIASLDFYRLVQHALADNGDAAAHEGSLVKSTSSDTADIDLLMKQASKSVPIKHVDRTAHLQGSIARENKASKVERKLQHILKKL